MILVTEGGPVDLLAGEDLLGGGLLLGGDGVELRRGHAGDQQGHDGNDGDDGLGLLIQILILEQENDQRNEADAGHDDAKLGPDIEQELVLAAHGVDPVGALPELGRDDGEDQIQHDGKDQEKGQVHGGQEVPRERQDRKNFTGDGKRPEHEGKDAEQHGAALRRGRARLGFFLLGGFRFFGGLLSGFLGSVDRLGGGFLGGIRRLCRGFLGGFSGLAGLFTGHSFSHFCSSILKI